MIRLVVSALRQPAGPAHPQAETAQVDNIPRVEKLFEKWDKPTSPGCALAVIKNGRIVYRHGFGMADLDHDVPISPSTVFHVASMSKQFAAAAIVMLAQQGKLSLDDQVRKYVPELPDFGVPITIRHLIHHTSGLRDQWELLGLAGWRYSLDLITDQDVLSVLSRQKELNFRPGEKHLYCNTGYTLLAQIVKRVSGESFREFTTSRIFQPLGMKSSHFRDDHAEIVKNMAYGYVGAKDGAFRLSITNFDTAGATSLLTTVEDLALWDQNFYGPRVGGPDLIRQMLEPGKLNDGERLAYAFGLVLGKYRGLPTVDHFGGDAGYRSDLVRFPEQHLSVACLCNLAESNPIELTRKVADIYLGKEPEEKPVELSEAQLTSKVGFYWHRDGDQLRNIALKDGKLSLVSGDESYELKPLSEERFRMVLAPVELAFKSERPGGPLRLAQTGPTGQVEVFDGVTPVTPTPQQLAEYVGTYHSDEIDALYRMNLEDGKLVLKRLKFGPDILRPVLRDLFLAEVGSVRFTRDPEGRVSGLVINGDRVRNFRFAKQLP